MTNKQKRQYRIRNWREYNKALVSRGSLTLWIDSRSIDKWLSQDRPARRGRRRTYTDLAVECCLMLKEVYHLPLRATQGLVRSVLRLLSINLPAPDYSTLSRRSRLLHLSLSAQQANQDALDRNTLPALLKQTEAEIERVCADGAYDFEQCYRAIKEREAVALIPPRRDAVIRGKSPFEHRDENLREIRRRGRKAWKSKSGYHHRSLVECAFFRLKTLFSQRLRSRREDTQTAEAVVRCAAMNRMTSLGMPDSDLI